MVYTNMSEESVSATTEIPASAEAVFAILTDPSRHAGIDGTGWVVNAVGARSLSSQGQIFRMTMYHPDHPNGSYETANEIIAFEQAAVISWRTGYIDQATGGLKFGGWWWRYDLAPVGPRQTEVALSYDWSAVGPGPREYL